MGRCELMDDSMVRVLNASNPAAQPWPPTTTLLYELTGLSQRAVQEQVQIVTDIARSHGGTDFYLAVR